MNHANKAATLSAFVFPGIGQFYNRQPVRGVLFTGIAGIAVAMLIKKIFIVAWEIANQIVAGTLPITDMLVQVHTAMWQFDEPQLVTAKWVLIGVWLVSIADAYWQGKKRQP